MVLDSPQIDIRFHKCAELSKPLEMSSALLGTLPPTVPAGADWEIKAQRARIPGYTSCDAGTAKVVECSTMTTFWQAAPDALALAIRCAEAHIVVGYSMHVVGDHGL